MTKKFWKDWQNRIGETKNIWLFLSIMAMHFMVHIY